MAVLESVPAADSIIRKLVVEEKRSYSDVSTVLKATFPQIAKGFSCRSIRRYCKQENIQKTSRLEQHAVDRLVETSIQKVNHACMHAWMQHIHIEA